MGKTKVKSNKMKSKSDVWYTVLAIVIGVCLVFGLAVAIMQPTGLVDYISMHTQTALKSDHYSINNAQFTYQTYATYNNYYQTYSSYASYLGLDRTKPLSQQKYSDTMSWLDYCKDEAKYSLIQVLALCEAAKANGYEMSADDKKSIDDNLKALSDFAKQNNYSLSNAIAAMYGSKGIKKGDIKGVLEMQTIASGYANQIRDSYTYTNEDYDKYYEENKYDYLKADYYSYTVKADYESGATDEEKEAAISAAKAKADELFAKIEGGEDFVKVIYEYRKELAEAEKKAAEEALEEAKKNASTSAADTGDTTSASEEKSAEEKALDDATKALEELTEESVKKSVLTEGHQTTADNKSEADQWIFADTPAHEGDTKLIAADESATIYKIVKSVYRDEYNTASIRELGLSLTNFTNADAMKEYAEMIQDEFNKGEKTGEAFDALAEKFTTDKITVSASGLEKEAMRSTGNSTYEELNDWMFSSERKPGDVKAFVFEDQGMSIVFYEEQGRAAWLAAVDSAKRSADLNEAVKGFEETYPATVNDNAIAKVE